MKFFNKVSRFTYILKDHKKGLTIYFLFVFISALFFINYGLNDVINFLNKESCAQTIDINSYENVVLSQTSTNDLECVGQIIKYEQNSNTAYVGILNGSLINLLKILFLIVLLIYPIILLLKALGVHLNIYNLLDNKNYFTFFIFYIFLFSRYLNSTLTNGDYLVSLNISLTEFILFNISYFVLFLLLLQLPRLSKNLIYNYLIFLILVTIPIFNYFNLLSNYFLGLIIVFNIFVLNIYRSENIKKINLILFSISLVTTLQLLFSIASTFENKAWVSEVQELFKGKESFLTKNEIIEEQNIASKNLPPIIIFWFDELPSGIISTDSGVRKNFPNLNEFSNESYNFLKNNSNSSYSKFVIDGLFNDESLDIISANFNLKTIEPFSDICNFEFCDFQLQKFKTEKFKINFYDIAAIYLNYFSLDLYSQFIPDIYTVTSNFWTNKDIYDISSDKSIYYDYESTKYLLNNIENDDFLFTHLIFPHMPWKYFRDGTVYIESESSLTSNFLIEPNKPGALNWNNEYKKNDYYQYIEISRLIEQTIFMDKIFGEYIEILKKNKLYEKSLIIFTSDHGINFNPKMNSRGASENNLGVYHTPLLVKLPNQNNSIVIKENSSHKIILELIEDIVLENQLNKTIKNHKHDSRVKVFERDSFEKIEKNELYQFSIDSFNYQINKESIFFENSFDFFNNDFGWKNINLETDQLTEITNNIKIKNVDKNTSKKYFYLTINAEGLINENIYLKNKNQVLSLPHNLISKNTSELTVLLDKPINYTELSKVQFFTNK
jgi:hypothetical protein